MLDDISAIDSAGYTATGITTMAGVDHYITFDDYVSAVEHSIAGSATSYDSSIELLYKSSCQTNVDGSYTGADDGSGDDQTVKVLCQSAVYQLDLDVDPFNEDGVKWLKKTRDVIDRYVNR